MINKILRSKLFKASLRVKILLAFVLPMLFVVSGFSYFHNLREQQELEDIIERSTIQLGDMALSGMKNSMLRNDRDAVNRILNNIGKNPSIKEMKIVDADFRIAVSTDETEVGTTADVRQAGCAECHNTPAPERPRVTGMRLSRDLLRVVSPIANEPACQNCHPAEKKHLGVLIIDAPLSMVAAHAQEDRIYNVGISVVSVLVIAVISYLMIHWLVVKRVGVLYQYLNAFAAGDFSIRIPKVWRTEDEITYLADHFNRIADALERQQNAQREVAIVRQEAIAEERERIAHDLHDGIAQLLAYLTTKISAAQVALSKNNSQATEAHLLKMDEAVQRQMLDVRAMIAGLRMVGNAGIGLAANMKEYVETCNRLTDIHVIFNCAPEAETLELHPETELQLLRITQEAISNARKHSAATEVTVFLFMEENALLLEVCDNGVGFDPWSPALWRAPHFGLHTMRERAEKIGASFRVEAAKGSGARVLVNLNLPKEQL
jgi:signal transduction histidine kinase